MKGVPVIVVKGRVTRMYDRSGRCTLHCVDKKGSLSILSTTVEPMTHLGICTSTITSYALPSV